MLRHLLYFGIKLCHVAVGVTLIVIDSSGCNDTVYKDGTMYTFLTSQNSHFTIYMGAVLGLKKECLALSMFYAVGSVVWQSKNLYLHLASSEPPCINI